MHPASVGYLQGMNNIAACLLYHSDQVLAFELLIRTINDYHLKEVHMAQFPGLYEHCETFDLILPHKMPKLAAHFKQLNVIALHYCQNWFFSLFTQQVPIQLSTALMSLFFRDGWKAIYTIILQVLKTLEDELLKQTTSLKCIMLIN